MLLSRMERVGTRERIQKRWAGPRVEFVAMALGMASFLMEELMHFLLAPNIGRHWERLLAEVISAVVVAWLAALLMKSVNRNRAVILLRMQVISEMNEHVRTALDEISLTTQTIENQQCIRKISESVGHIEWALREVLLRPLPVPEGSGEHRLPGRVGPRSERGE
jgi:hypothetical protein